MGKKDGGASEEAQQARADEQARQARIRAGTTRIGQIFEGGAITPTGRLATGTRYDPKSHYYTAEGKVWTPTAGATAAPPVVVPTGPRPYQGGRDDRPGTAVGGTATAASPTTVAPTALTPEQQFIEAMKGGLYSGVTKSQGTFNPAFYDRERKAYIDYATPQLLDQYGDARKQLIFAMARSGNLNSSANAGKGGELTRLYDTNKRNIVDQANSYVNQTKANVEDARQGLIQTLNATGDAEGAASGAIRRAQSLSAPPSYSPLTQLFADFSASLGAQAANEQANRYYAPGQGPGRYNTGIFTPGRVSVT